MYKTISITTSIAAAMLLTACSSTSQNTVNNEMKPLKHSITFSEVSVPKSNLEKRKVRASSNVTIDGVKHKIGYNTILRSGDKVGNGVFGQLFDNKGNPIVGKDGSLKVSNNSDFSSLLPIGDKLFMVSQFETRPAAMYVTELEKTEDGHLKAINTQNIDMSDINGLWVPCAGSVTPWNSHLSSEEYEPNAKIVKEDGSINAYYNQMADYYGGDLKALNPYDYGWTPEVKVLNEKGETSIEKHYSMGRFAHELAYVMPDEKTVFLSDDGTNVALFMFIADKKRDLSAGTLYAAKWNQTSNIGAGSADLTWVNLGHSTNATIKKELDKKIKFNDIFEEASANNMQCPTGFTSINTTMKHECLKVKEGMEEIASRMESRRYAAIKGATTEFRKMEGISFNKEGNTLYLGMSAIARGMEDFEKKGTSSTKYDGGGYNDIKLPYNQCGAVYSLQMNNYETIDTSGKRIDSSYIPNSMKSLVEGWADNSVSGNKCSVDSLANPDNVTYISNTNTLIIGEDTGSGHQNDYVWSYSIDDDKLTRILTTPYGSETTSPYYYNNIKGHGYLMTVVQHPYGEGDALTKVEDMKSTMKNAGELRAYTGYVGPLPVISK